MVNPLGRLFYSASTMTCTPRPGCPKRSVRRPRWEAKPTSLKVLRELLHCPDAADFEPLGNRNGVRVSLDKGDEVTDKFR